MFWSNKKTARPAIPIVVPGMAYKYWSNYSFFQG